jgi:FlaA1/EpsC-like NDP-sugar epimerase
MSIYFAFLFPGIFYNHSNAILQKISKMPNNGCVLVTGASGYIGSHTIVTLLEGKLKEVI